MNWWRQWHPTPVLLPGKSHGQRSLVGCSPWGHEELDMTERLHFHFSLSCLGGGNGNPLQYYCLENPRDGGARWAAVYGVTQSRTRLKRLSSSSSSRWWISWAKLYCLLRGATSFKKKVKLCIILNTSVKHTHKNHNLFLGKWILMTHQIFLPSYNQDNENFKIKIST